MKNAKVGSEKILKAAKPRRVAGVPVRSGVKAGRRWDAGNTGGGGGGRREFLQDWKEKDWGKQGGI
jgi:hypothetical protein